MIKMSERVYNFQRVFNIRLGKGLRANDAIPYRPRDRLRKKNICPVRSATMVSW